MQPVQVIRVAWGNPFVKRAVTEIVFNYGPSAAEYVWKEGVPKAKTCGRKICNKVARRYGKQDKSFVVTEKGDRKDGHHFVSVSRDFDEEFIQTWHTV